MRALKYGISHSDMKMFPNIILTFHGKDNFAEMRKSEKKKLYWIAKKFILDV